MQFGGGGDGGVIYSCGLWSGEYDNDQNYYFLKDPSQGMLHSNIKQQDNIKDNRDK